MLYLAKLNNKDDDEEKYMLSDFREKMAGANLYENNVEGAFELWLERDFLGVDANGFPPLSGKGIKRPALVP